MQYRKLANRINIQYNPTMPERDMIDLTLKPQAVELICYGGSEKSTTTIERGGYTCRIACNGGRLVGYQIAINPWLSDDTVDTLQLLIERLPLEEYVPLTQILDSAPYCVIADNALYWNIQSNKGGIPRETIFTKRGKRCRFNPRFKTEVVNPDSDTLGLRSTLKCQPVFFQNNAFSVSETLLFVAGLDIANGAIDHITRLMRQVVETNCAFRPNYSLINQLVHPTFDLSTQSNSKT